MLSIIARLMNIDLFAMMALWVNGARPKLALQAGRASMLRAVYIN